MDKKKALKAIKSLKSEFKNIAEYDPKKEGQKLNKFGQIESVSLNVGVMKARFKEYLRILEIIEEEIKNE